MKTYLTRPSKGGKRGEGKGGEDCAALTFFSRTTTTKGSPLPKSTSPWEITPQGKQQKGEGRGGEFELIHFSHPLSPFFFQQMQIFLLPSFIEF